MKYDNVKMIGDCDTVRFLLEIPGDNQIVIIGANPSTANESEPDRTVTMAMSIAERYNYNGVVFLNLYAQRSTNPNELDPAINQPLHAKNLEIIKSVLKRIERPSVLLCFGDLVLKRPYLTSILHEILTIFPCCTSWFKMGDLTMNGNPRHLSRLSHSTQMTNAFNYVSKIIK